MQPMSMPWAASSMRFLTGKPPFLGGADAVREAHLHKPAPALPIDGSRLAGFIATMLRKSPTSRPPLSRCAAVIEAVQAPRSSGARSTTPMRPCAAKSIWKLPAKLRPAPGDHAPRPGRHAGVRLRLDRAPAADRRRCGLALRVENTLHRSGFRNPSRRGVSIVAPARPIRRKAGNGGIRFFADFLRPRAESSKRNARSFISIIAFISNMRYLFNPTGSHRNDCSSLRRGVR